VRVRFALHRESETLSLKQKLPPETELVIGMVLQLDGRAAVIEALHLRGGRRVRKATAWDLKRVTCRWKRDKRGRRDDSRRRSQRTSSEHSDEARKRLTDRGGRRKG
jgi:uncharacterized Zn finger protein